MRKTTSTLSIVIGSLLIIGGVVTWIVVSTTLADQKITVSDDASCLAGDEVTGRSAPTARRWSSTNTPLRQPEVCGTHSWPRTIPSARRR
jgi:hypothetical protein